MDKTIAVISQYLKKHAEIEDEELFRYGLSSLIKYILFAMILIPIAIYLNILKECSIFLILFILIRIYAGGYHMQSAIPCLLLSILLIVVIPLTIVWYSFSNLTVCILFLFGTCFLYIYAPIANHNKMISSSERLYFKKKVRFLLFIYLLLFIFLQSLGFYQLATFIALAIFTNAVNVLIAFIQNRRKQICEQL